MTTTQNQLATELANLPIAVGQVLLWLVYRGLRPMASIILTADWSDHSVQTTLSHWLTEANLAWAPSQLDPRTLHVARSQPDLDTFVTNELDERPAAHQIRGQLYGFPPAAAQAFAQAVATDDLPPTSQLVIHSIQSPELLATDYYPYVEYLVRPNHALEDSEPARHWAALVRTEIPELAAAYEANRRHDLEQLQSHLQNDPE